MATAVAASSLAELSWVEGGRPHTHGVIALLRQGRPAVAFPYADEALARSVASSSTVALSLTEPRSTGAAFRPLLATGRPVLVEDPQGDVYTTDLMLQELHRYPPARAYVDSPILQREHWWYLPRLIVELDVDSVRPVPAREDAAHHLLVVATDGAPSVHVVRVPGDLGDSFEPDLDRPPSPGPAVVFGQDASFPDLENRAQWTYCGAWDGTAFTVHDRPGRTGLGPTPGLWKRWRRHRDLERRCVAAIPTKDR